MTQEAGFRVELTQFAGPLDLLLYLLKEDELDVETIPVAEVCDRYLEYLGDLEAIDLDSAGEFLVMASLLMRIKSRALLPQEMTILDDEELDPRFELIRQLVEYRRFKQAAGVLEERRADAAQRFGRGMRPELREARAAVDPATRDLEGVDVERLFATFTRLLQETEAAAGYVVTRDDTPMETHIARLREQLPPGREVPFRDLFPKGANRGYVLGVFLALLELMRQFSAEVAQESAFGEILVRGCEPEPLPEAGAEVG